MPGSATLNGSGGGRRRRAGVAELADAQDLGSCTERCRGSTPLSCTVVKRFVASRGRWRKDRGMQFHLLSSVSPLLRYVAVVSVGFAVAGAAPAGDITVVT